MADMTLEFAARLRQSLDSCPHAPEAQYGRLTWLQRELEKHASLRVSVNSVHKWVNGTSRPRPDNIRVIARVLGVDEVWLNLGHEPVVSADSASVQSHKATGVVMTIAGLIEQHGGRVTFPDAAEKTPHLYVNFDADRYGLLVVVPQIAGDSISFIVPEPIRQHRIVGVITQAGSGAHSFTTDVFDLTNSPRQVFGGFSVIEFDQNTKGELRAKGKKHTIIPIKSFADLNKAKG